MANARSPSAKRAKKPPSKVGLVWGSVFAVIGAILFALGAWSATLGYETTHWPEVEATIVTANASYLETRDNPTRSTSESAFLELAFAYEVGERRYTASGVVRGSPGAPMQSTVRKLATRLHYGDKTRLVYNPANPAEAYLIPGIAGMAYILGGMGLGLLLIGMLTLATYRAGLANAAAKRQGAL